MENRVDASPTKDFFIGMLTKDIGLEHAIIDLTDNSIDGALTLRPNEDFTGLWIKLSITETTFQIEDNCGGFSLETAQKYAFKFGRPTDREDVNHSVGRFGVGMKRALFRMGNHFIVESKHKTDHFSVEVDVAKWSSNAENWFFDYSDKGAKLTDEYDGTVIIVDELHSYIKSEFRIETYFNFLKREIEKKHDLNFAKGIQIFLNGERLNSKHVLLSFSENLKPIQRTLTYGEVKVQLFAGLTTALIDSAGWSIYCNDRMVVEADRTKLTGWGEDKTDDEAKMRRFHHSFAMFRGVVLFDSKDPKLLPMKTTKDGIDSNSDIYRAVKLEMKNMMRQILNYLSKIESDKDRETLIADTTEINVLQMRQKTLTSVFVGPEINALEATNNQITVSYKKDRKLVEKVKTALNVTSVREMGEKTFDYYCKNEL